MERPTTLPVSWDARCPHLLSLSTASASLTDDIVTRIRVDIQVRDPQLEVVLGQQHRFALVKKFRDTYTCLTAAAWQLAR